MVDLFIIKIITGYITLEAEKLSTFHAETNNL